MESERQPEGGDAFATTQLEEWRECPGYSGRYVVSNRGRVLSLWSQNGARHAPLPIGRGNTSKGYFIVVLRTPDGVRHHHGVHHLVARACVNNALHM